MARYIKLEGVTITDPTAPRALTTYATDDFNRADGPLTTTQDGKTYLQQYGAYLRVIGNQLAGTGITNPSNPQAYGAKALVNAGTSEVEVSLTWPNGAGSCGHFLRSDAAFNGYALMGNGPNQIDFFRYSSNGTARTTLATFPGYGITAGMVIKVVCTGDNMTIYRNGVLLGTVTDATYKGTHHGARIAADTHRLDDLKITSLTY